jgi:hypothetical protein
MTRFPLKQRVFVISILACALLLIGPLALWYRSHSQRSEAVRIAARAYLRRFGQPAPPYRRLPRGQVAQLSARSEPSRNAYIIDFGYQYVARVTRRDILGSPISFASFTVIESFAVLPDSGCVYLGHHSGGDF